MKNLQEVIASVQGMDADAQAKAIAAFIAQKNRKKTVEEQRRDIRNKVFAGCKKLTKAQQESLLYEFINANANYINNWLKKNYADVI